MLLLAAVQQGPVQLDLPTGLPEQFQTDVAWNDKAVTLKLHRRSLRAENFILENSDGAIDQIPPSCTYFGFVDGLEGATVAASLEPRGLMATVLLADQSIWQLEPNQKRGGGWHQLAPAKPGPAGMCGVTDDTRWTAHAHDVGSGNGGGRNVNVPPPSRGNRIVSPFPWVWTMRKSRIAFDATYDYWLREGQTVAGVTAGVEYQLAQNDITCARDALVTYELTGIVIRQAQYYTGTTSGALLNEFAYEWDTNQSHIPRESAVMLEDYQGDGIAGLAWVGTLGGGLAYAGLYWDRGYSPGIIAHEVGHNWGAGHIDCWPWGGSAMCGSWLLYGPDTTNIILNRAAWLNLPVVDPYADPVRPYADPDWTRADTQSNNDFDVLNNDYDANFDRIHVSAVDATTAQGGTATVLFGAGPGGRDLVEYKPDRMRLGPYTDSFWYAASDPDGQELWTPVTIDVREHSLVAEWKFEEGTGVDLLDTSGNQNDGSATKPITYAELADPALSLACISNSWSPVINLFDNDSKTDFSSANQGAVSANFSRDPADGTWLELDFGSTTTVEGFRHQDRENANEWIAKSVLWFSNDSVFNSSDTMVEIQHHSHGEYVEYGFKTVRARYVRWEVVEQFDQNSGLHSLGGKELAFLYQARMGELDPPVVTLSSNSQSGNGAENLVDSYSESEFVSAGQGVVSAALTRNPADGTWAEFDFQGLRTFEGASFLDLTGIKNWTGQSRLWFSNTPNFALTDASILWDQGNQKYAQLIDFDAIRARYMRWEITAKAPNTFFNNVGGRELTMLTDVAPKQGFVRVPGPYGDCLKILNGLEANTKSANNLPVGSNDPFTLNVHIKPDAGLGGGIFVAGFGDPGDSDSRYFELINGNLHFAGIDSGWTPPATAWSMLTASFDGVYMSLYYDAILLGTWPVSFGATSSELHLAPTDANYSTTSYRGLIDEFSVWNYALSTTEITSLQSGGAAHGPIPFDTRTMISNAPQLSWVPGLNNPLHDVYLANDFDSAKNANTTSAEYLGRFADATLDLQNLNPRTWYFWRVDEIHSNGDSVPGKVWRFRTELPWTITAFDGFADGADNQHLNGLAGGDGFGAAWDVPSGNGYKHRNGSIGAYPSNVPFLESGGYLERKAVSDLTMEGQRSFDTNLIDLDIAGDGTFYLSFALRLNGTDDDMIAMCGLKSSTLGETITAGVEGGAWQISGSAGTATGSVTSRSRTHFVVLRVDASGQNPDYVWMKHYDSASETVHSDDSQLVGVGPGINQWDLVSSGADGSGNFDQLFIRAGGNRTFFSNSKVEIDEIRVGRSWLDVTGL